MWMSFKLSLPLTAWLQQVNLNKLILFSVLHSFLLPAEVVEYVCSEQGKKKPKKNSYSTVWLLSINTNILTCRLYLSPLFVLSSGSLPLPMRKPTRRRGTETGWMLSWTGWPACCRSRRMSSPSWTSCLCCALQCPTSVSRVSSKVKVDICSSW